LGQSLEVLVVNGGRACWACLIAVALTAWLAASPTVPKADKSGPVIRFNEGGATVEVTGLSKGALAGLAKLAPEAEKWAEVLAVYVDRGGKGRDGQPAMLGSYRVEKEALRFTPRFPLTKGVRYQAVFNPAALPGGAGGKAVELALFLPKPVLKPTTVVASVYPSTDRVPENLLKFYLHFSAPMSQGDSYRHIKLLDAKGKAVDLPFLELDQELWAPSGTRLTVFFDPGRIKRGLKPREEVGPALEEGKRYTLVIDRGWSDAAGAPLKETFRKTFTVGAPDDAPPNLKTWKLKAPTVGTAALRVTFPKPMDHALLERLVWVVDASGTKVAGKVAVTERETVWLFTPASPWRAGAYHLVADTRLEDLSGNSIGRPFEVDVLRPVERVVKTETVKVPFSVKK
jgi:hypothetical protein